MNSFYLHFHSSRSVICLLALLSTGACQQPVLDGIFPNCGVIQPSFQPGRFSYTLTLPRVANLPPITVIAQSKLAGVHVRVDQVEVPVGQSSNPLDTSFVRHIIIAANSDSSFIGRYCLYLNFIKPEIIRNSDIRLFDVNIDSTPPPSGPNVPRYMDTHGALYTVTRANTVMKSNNGGQTWDSLFTVPLSYGYLFDQPCLVVGKTGVVVLATTTGCVLVSNPQQTAFNLAFRYLSKWPTLPLAHSIYDSLIFLGTYAGMTNDSLGWNEVYMSRNNGETWGRIFADSSRDHRYVFHIHDVKYDPFSNRIWVVTGDVLNNQIYYSDNWGATWNKVFSDYTLSRQSTQAIPFNIGVVFASDQFRNTVYDGLHFWLRPQNNLHAPVSLSQFTFSENFVKIGDSLGLAHFGIEGSDVEKEGETFHLLPWFSDPVSYQDSSRLWGTFNGLTWYELYSAPSPTHGAGGFFNIVGPLATDTLNRIWAAWDGSKGSSLLTARIMFPPLLTSPKCVSPVDGIAAAFSDPTLSWQPLPYALNYEIQVATDSEFVSTSLADSLITGTNYYCSRLSKKSNYYWRVKAVGFGVESPWSSPELFTSGSCLSSVSPQQAVPGSLPMLSQNFPNPFNPATTIRYLLSKPTYVRLQVYNGLGQLIETLVNSEQQPGLHQFVFNAAKLASGVYFFQLDADGLMETRKMVVVK